MGKIDKSHNMHQYYLGGDYFVGRDELINRFWNDYSSHAEEDSEWTLSVINYYGMSGIGKTELANCLYNQHIDKECMVVFFTFLEDQSFLSNILELKKCIESGLKISFPLFDMAYMAYMCKSGRRVDIEYCKTVLNSDIVEALYPILNVIPKVNIFAAIIQAIKPFEKKLNRLFSEENLYFIKESPDKIYNKLMFYFAEDLCCSLRKQKKPITILLDNIEPLLGEQFDEWFVLKNGLFRNIPNVIWCVCSQRAIVDKLDKKDKIIQSYAVDALSYAEVENFLKHYGVAAEYFDKIFSVSEGIPVYVTIMTELYFDYLSEGRLEEFRLDEGKEKLINHYFKYLDEYAQTVLKVLAFLETWTADIAIELLNNMGIAVEIYERIIQHTYVRSWKNRFYLHSLLVEAIKTDISTKLYSSIAVGIEKMEEKVKNDFMLSLLRIKASLSQTSEMDIDAEVFNLYPLYEKIKSALDYDYMYKLHRVVVSLYLKYNKKMLGESLSYYMYGKLYLDTGFSSQALDYISRAYSIVTSSVKPISMKENAYKEYALAIKEEYANALFNNRYFNDSIAIRKELWDQSIALHGSKSFFTLSARQNYFSALSRVDLEKGISGLVKILHDRSTIVLRKQNEIVDNERFKVFAKESLSRAYLNSKKYEEAVKLGFEAYGEAVEQFGENELITQQIMNSLNEVLMELRAYSDVVSLLEEKYLFWKEHLPVDSGMLISMKYSLGIAYGECGRIEEGKELLMDIYQFAHDRYGVSDKDTLRYRKEYAICLANGGQSEAAIDILEDCKDIYERVYGNDGSEQLRNILVSLVVEYKKTHNIENMEKEKEHLLELGYFEDTERSNSGSID